MSQKASIQTGEVKGYSWVRIDGRGDVFLAPLVKKFTDQLLESSSSQDSPPKLVLDMEVCTGMDSTFMGMLAGLAIKFQGIPQSVLQLCFVSQKNVDSLEELGIDSLLDINPSVAEWADQFPHVRTTLKVWGPDQKSSPDAKLILDTHKTLGSLNEKNKAEFSGVIKTFEDQLPD